MVVWIVLGIVKVHRTFGLGLGYIVRGEGQVHAIGQIVSPLGGFGLFSGPDLFRISGDGFFLTSRFMAFHSDAGFFQSS